MLIDSIIFVASITQGTPDNLRGTARWVLSTLMLQHLLMTCEEYYSR
jgi:hypothetical protein